MTVFAQFSPRLRLIEKPTVDAAADIEDGSLDLVFIDANHTYEGCRDDILAWRPKLRAGGWLTGHDYFPEAFPGVVKAVDELVPGFKLEGDYVWMAQI